MPETTGEPLSGLHRRYRRTIDTIVTMTAAMRDSGATVGERSAASGPRQVSDTALWTFEQPRFPTDRRVRVRVGGSGFVHAGIEEKDGLWCRVADRLCTFRRGLPETIAAQAGIKLFSFLSRNPADQAALSTWERGPGGTRLFRAGANDSSSTCASPARRAEGARLCSRSPTLMATTQQRTRCTASHSPPTESSCHKASMIVASSTFLMT